MPFFRIHIIYRLIILFHSNGIRAMSTRKWTRITHINYIIRTIISSPLINLQPILCDPRAWLECTRYIEQFKRKVGIILANTWFTCIATHKLDFSSGAVIIFPYIFLKRVFSQPWTPYECTTKIKLKLKTRIIHIFTNGCGIGRRDSCWCQWWWFGW